MDEGQDQAVDVTHQLAGDYKVAVDELARHWADADGRCEVCPDEPYPCHMEWVTRRRIVAIETRWRNEALRRVELLKATG